MIVVPSLPYRAIQSLHTTVHQHLVSALLLATLTFIVGISRTEVPVGVRQKGEGRVDNVISLLSMGLSAFAGGVCCYGCGRGIPCSRMSLLASG